MVVVWRLLKWNAVVALSCPDASAAEKWKHIMPVVLYLITLVASSGVGIMSVRDAECELLWLACRRADQDGIDRSKLSRSHGTTDSATKSRP